MKQTSGQAAIFSLFQKTPNQQYFYEKSSNSGVICFTYLTKTVLTVLPDAHEVLSNFLRYLGGGFCFKLYSSKDITHSALQQVSQNCDFGAK